MSDDEYKKYTEQAKRGIKGEAFFETLVSDYCIPHRIAGPKDLGLDYICEWVFGDKPTGVLFAAQIKTFSEATAKPKFVAVDEDYNGLRKYEIRNQNLRVDASTLRYWEGFGIPIYLFAVVQSAVDDRHEELNCYYKRYTSILTGDRFPEEDSQYYANFYKVNEGDSFIAFRRGYALGFARDLFIDHVRWCYCKGSITYIDPRTIGLAQFEKDKMFIDLIKNYKEQICSAFLTTKRYLDYLGYDCQDA